jgi:hypothetical protein
LLRVRPRIARLTHHQHLLVLILSIRQMCSRLVIRTIRTVRRRLLRISRNCLFYLNNLSLQRLLSLATLIVVDDFRFH